MYMYVLMLFCTYVCSVCLQVCLASLWSFSICKDCCVHSLCSVLLGIYGEREGDTHTVVLYVEECSNFRFIDGCCGSQCHSFSLLFVSFVV